MTNRTQEQRRENKRKYSSLVEQARKWPNLEEGIANDFAMGRFKEDLVCGARDIATRVYERTESAGIENDIKDLDDIRYAYIMSCSYDREIGGILREVGALIRDKLDYIRVEEMRKSLR